MNNKHKLLVDFQINETITPIDDTPKEEAKKPVVIEENFFVNAAVNPLFKYTNTK